MCAVKHFHCFASKNKLMQQNLATESASGDMTAASGVVSLLITGLGLGMSQDTVHQAKHFFLWTPLHALCALTALY